MASSADYRPIILTMMPCPNVDAPRTDSRKRSRHLSPASHPDRANQNLGEVPTCP
ncbi:hypothetical protein LIA77_07538 [Sarocladium implicatum]|nr:hypothetical protein LIA77_07538 [Sarocladium implicatum]